MTLEQSYIGFVDVLGYRHIALGPGTDDEKAKRLRSIYQAIIGAMDDTLFDENSGDTFGFDSCKFIHFSDCFYFTSRSPATLAFAIAQFFHSVFSLYQSTYVDDEEWLPYLRAGIAKDWYIKLRDPTCPIGGDERFRNPVGPAVAKAYMKKAKPRAPRR